MPRRRLRGPADQPALPAQGVGPVFDVLPGGPVPPPASLQQWLERLTGLPRPLHRVVPVGCRHHDEEDDAPLSRVQADPVAGVALRRCEACDDAVHLLDSESRWTAPPLWDCAGCGTSQLELAAGLSIIDGEHVDWVVLAGRCAGCHAMTGLTDVLVDRLTASEVIAAL